MIAHMDSWCLLLTPPARGAWNMAVDEAFLESGIRRARLHGFPRWSVRPPLVEISKKEEIQAAEELAKEA
jgi:hypothetical protein